MTATFTKLNDGRWGLRVAGHPQAGEALIVTKKDGSQSEIIVGRILWAGQDRDGNDAALTTITETARRPRRATRRAQPADDYKRRNGRCEDAPCCGCCGPQSDDRAPYDP